MTIASPPVIRPVHPLLPRATAAMLLGAGAALVIWQVLYRTMETRLAALLIDLVTSAGVYVAPERQTVYFGLGTDYALGLRITPECTSAFLVVPLLAVAAAMIVLRPWITRRVLLSLGLAVVVMVLVNQVRVLTLVWLIATFGRDRGYYLGHTLFGSMVSVLGGVAALVLFVWLSTRAPRAARQSRQPA